MDPLHVFEDEVRSLADTKLPVSRPKIISLTKAALKAVKMYKHVVQAVEKFIQHCPLEYKIPGLYVIDAIIRQSRLMYADEDLYAPRFLKNLHCVFGSLSRLPTDEKRMAFKVLDLWRNNSIFPAEFIQCLANILYAPGDMDLLEKAKVLAEDITKTSAEKVLDHVTSSRSLNEKIQDAQDKITEYSESLLRGNKINYTDIVRLYDLLMDLNCAFKDEENFEGFDREAIDHINVLTNSLGEFFTDSARKRPRCEDKEEEPGGEDDYDEAGVKRSRCNIGIGQSSPRSKTLSWLSGIAPPEIEQPRPASPAKSPSRRSDLLSNGCNPSAPKKTPLPAETESQVRRRRARLSLPPLRTDHICVLSKTIFIGRLHKQLVETRLKALCEEVGEGIVVKCNFIPPRGCAFVTFASRRSAYKAVQALENAAVDNREVKVAWAPNEGVKMNPEVYPKYWDVELGCTYIPYSDISKMTPQQFQDLTKGQAELDEDSLPAHQVSTIPVMPQAPPPSLHVPPPPIPSSGFVSRGIPGYLLMPTPPPPAALTEQISQEEDESFDSRSPQLIKKKPVLPSRGNFSSR